MRAAADFLAWSTDIGFPVVKSFDFKEFKQLQSVQEKNREGFVIRFQSGVRVKLKFEEYKKLHRASSHISTTTVWEVLKDGGDVKDLLEILPVHTMLLSCVSRLILKLCLFLGRAV